MSKCVFPETTGQESEKPLTEGTESSSDMRNALGALFQLDKAVLRPRAQTAPDMTIHVNPARLSSFYSHVYGTTTTPITYAGGNTGTITAPSANPRYDIVYLDTADSTIKIITGAEAGSPVPLYSSLPSTAIPICTIYLPITADRILNYEDKDTDATEGYIASDLRPFLNVGGGVALADFYVLQDNMALLGFRQQVDHSKSVLLYEDGWTDEFNDATGIGTATNCSRNANNYYENAPVDACSGGTALSNANGTGGTDQVPTMTGASTPSGVASASTEYSTYYAWQAFDKASTLWTANATTGWLKYDFGAGVTKTIVAYNIKGTSGTVTRTVKTWTFEGSNNDSDWTVLDTQTNQPTWVANEIRNFAFVNTTAYRYYRLNISANQGHASYVEIQELAMFEALAKERAFDDSDSTYFESSPAGNPTSYAGTGADAKMGDTTTAQHGRGQSFTPTSSAVLSGVIFSLKKVGSPSYNVTANLYLASSGVPTGGALASSNAYAVSGLTTSYQEITFNFTTPYQTTRGVQYVVVLEANISADASNYIAFQSGTTDALNNGTEVVKNNADAWATASNDSYMKTIGVQSGYAYIGYDFGSNKTVKYFSIKQHADAQAINSVKVEGSADGSSWTTIQTSSITANSVKQQVDVTNSTAYRYYRLLANASTSSGGWQVDEVEFMEVPPNMTLISTSPITPGSAPTEMRLIIREQDGAVACTVNTDYLGWVSRDNGSTWTQITLVNEGLESTGINIISGSVSVSSQPSGTQPKFKITSANNKHVKIHAVACLMRF